MSPRPLRIGYTCHDALPSTHTNTQQIIWTLSEVARLGHTVDLCVPAIRGGDGADASGRIARHYGVPGGQLPGALRVIPAGRNDASSALAKGLFDLRAPSRFAPSTHELIWTRDPMALVRAVRTGLPVFFETYRPDFAAAPAFAPWRSAALRAGALAGVITHSRLAADAFEAAGVARERVLVAHNGHAPSLMEPVYDRPSARTRLGLPLDRPLVVYTGHVGPAKGTDALVALAAALPEVTVVIVGVESDSAEGAWVRAQAAAAGALNLLLLPRVELAAVARYLYAADCLVVPPTDEPLERYGRTVLPMKLFSYMAAGRPILAPDLPDVREVLTDGHDARLVRPGDSAAAAAAVRALIAEPAEAERLACQAQRAAQQYTWAARAERVTSWMQERLGR